MRGVTPRFFGSKKVCFQISQLCKATSKKYCGAMEAGGTGAGSRGERSRSLPPNASSPGLGLAVAALMAPRSGEQEHVGSFS